LISIAKKSGKETVISTPIELIFICDATVRVLCMVLPIW
jgi:hypothetical protein